MEVLLLLLLLLFKEGQLQNGVFLNQFMEYFCFETMPIENGTSGNLKYHPHYTSY